jgi:predicted metal-dependent HD superfamily phosphohydrolase
MLELSERFRSVWAHSAPETMDAKSDLAWQFLLTHYSESHRHYHNMDHISHCLLQLDEVAWQLEVPDAVELAIWFHDIIYQIGANDNELKSAEVFRSLAQPVMNQALIDAVCGLIMATTHINDIRDGDAAAMVDIDLSSFGLPWEEYLADSHNLRQEQKDTPDQQFYAGKLKFLKALTRRNAIFQTRYFREKLEQRARQNIARYVGNNCEVKLRA